MSTVVMHAVVSVDGFIADDDDQVGPLFDWYFNGDKPAVRRRRRLGASEHVDQCQLVRLRQTVLGQHSLRGGGTTPVRPHQRLGGEAADVREAIEVARELAGSGVVALSAGNVAGQALSLGLVDVVAMDVVPVVFGSGKRYFGDVDGQQVLEDPDVVVQGDGVLHLRYPVRGVVSGHLRSWRR